MPEIPEMTERGPVGVLEEKAAIVQCGVNAEAANQDMLASCAVE